jgi:UDP:flavonoid glycosyltransferase YjiC (YdhE family)
MKAIGTLVPPNQIDRCQIGNGRTMKLGFLCPNIPGHLNPMTALAGHLQARNHEVVFLYSTTAAGLPFVPAPENDHLNESIAEMNKLKGGDASSLALRALMAEMEAILETLPAMIRANGVDVNRSRSL